jgi:hypothetical protein
MHLEPKLMQNIEFGYDPSNHMMYLRLKALKKLKPIWRIFTRGLRRSGSLRRTAEQPLPVGIDALSNNPP